MTRKSFSFIERIRSFKYAFQGFSYLLTDQHNTRIHFIATIALITAAIYFELNRMEWCMVLIAAGLVWVTEILNTCIEVLADFISPQYNQTIGRIKDLAAAAVLISAAVAVAVGLIVFLPKVKFEIFTL